MASELLCKEISTRRDKRYDDGRRRSSPRNPYASNIGRCPREGYYGITTPESRDLVPTKLAQRFERGKDIERLANNELNLDRFEVIHGQVHFKIEEPIDGLGNLVICSGAIDGRIRWHGWKPVFEVKSLTPMVADRVNCMRDFLDMGDFWVRYPYQLLVYLLHHNEPFGLMIVDNCLGGWKVLPMVLLDWMDETEAALQWCRTVAVAVHKKEPPPFIKNPATCLRCWCYQAGACTPEMDFSGEGPQAFDDPELAIALERMEELQPEAKEFKRLDDRLKKQFKPMGDGIRLCGDFAITTKVGVTTVYKVPKEVKDQYKDKSTRTATTWERVAGDAPKSEDE